MGMVKDSTPQFIKVIDQLNKNYEFRYNTIKEIYEFKYLKNDDDFKEIEDYHLNSLCLELTCLGLSIKKSLLEQILNSNFIPIYNPFEANFKNLPKWNPDNESAIDQLCDTVDTTKQDFFKICFKRWVISVVASSINEKIINHQMIVFSGNQGIGKSSWIKNLLPRQLKDYFYSGTINHSNSDSAIYLSRCLLINLDELSNMRQNETSQLKEIITRSDINIRKAHSKNPKQYIRTASFIGSTNEEEFIYDLTGSRRFLCFRVKSFIYNHNVNMDDVFSEALYLFKNDEPYYFSTVDIRMIDSNNEQFRIKSVHEEKISISNMFIGVDYVEDYNNESFCYRYIFRVAEIYSYLYGSKKIPSNFDLSSLGKALTKMGFTSKMIGGGYKHYFFYSTLSSISDKKGKRIQL